MKIINNVSGEEFCQTQEVKKEKVYDVMVYAQVHWGKLYIKEPKIQQVINPNATQADVIRQQQDFVKQNSHTISIPAIINFQTQVTKKQAAYIFGEAHPVDPEEYEHQTGWQLSNGMQLGELALSLDGNHIVESYEEFCEYVDKKEKQQ
jgi:hypothetical protein